MTRLASTRSEPMMRGRAVLTPAGRPTTSETPDDVGTCILPAPHCGGRDYGAGACGRRLGVVAGTASRSEGAGPGRGRRSIYFASAAVRSIALAKPRSEIVKGISCALSPVAFTVRVVPDFSAASAFASNVRLTTQPAGRQVRKRSVGPAADSSI